MPLPRWLLALLSISIFTLFASAKDGKEASVKGFFGQQQQGHTNNWAVLVCTSRYWFNYRHMANTLGMYRTVKRLGIPDSNIILMLADDVACNPRNQFPATVYSSKSHPIDLYGDNIEIDYRGYDVNVENFIRLLTGTFHYIRRVDPTTPRSKRLLTDEKSNIFIYMTGHGGKDFLKFQDNEEIGAFDIADAFEQMWQKKRYNEIFFMIDTCQANTMLTKFYSPNILATGSSGVGENSYSYENDENLGVAVIDSFTHLVLSYFEGINRTSQATMQELFDAYDPSSIKSNPGIRADLFQRSPSKALLTDFFGGVAQAEPISPAEVEASHKIAAVRSKRGTEKDEEKEKERQEKRKGRGVSFGRKKTEAKVNEEVKEVVEETIKEEMKREDEEVLAQVQNATNVQVPTNAPFDFKLGVDAPVRAWAGLVAVAGWLVWTSWS